MKIIVIEGLDNTGKSTVINQLLNEFNEAIYIHCTKPENDDMIYGAIEQKEKFNKLFEKYVIDQCNNNTEPDAVIFDRSWVGEYVYGALYRGVSDKFAMDITEEITKKAITFIDNWNDKITKARRCDLYYILLKPRTPEFCIKNDDGYSLSRNNVEMVNKEIKRFDDIFYKIKSICMNENKGRCVHSSIVQVEDESGNFYSKDKIFNEIKQDIGID